VRGAAASAAALLVALLSGPLAHAQELPDPAAPEPPVEQELPDPAAPEPPVDAAAEVELTPEEVAALEAEAAAQRIDAERARVRAFAARELERVGQQLGEVRPVRDAVREEHEAARALLDSLIEAERVADASEQSARRDLGNLARLAYTSGPTEWTLIETFLDAESPGDALRRAAMTQRVAEAADGTWDRVVAAALDLQGRIKATRVRAAEAREALAAAEEQVELLQRQDGAIRSALADGGFVPGNGVKDVAALCGESEDPRCQPSGWGEGLLTRDAVWVMRTVAEQWPKVAEVGGYRASDPYPDHPSGRAVDVMVPRLGRTAQSIAFGDEVAEYFMTNADRFGVMYLIWNQRIWSNGRDPVAPAAQWRGMADRGDDTSNHVDHVHITVSTGVSGSGIYEVVRDQAE
jgi:hypothetical protein